MVLAGLILTTLAGVGCAAPTEPEEEGSATGAQSTGSPKKIVAKLKFEAFPSLDAKATGVATWRVSFLPNIGGESALLLEGRDEADGPVITLVQALDADNQLVALDPARKPWQGELSKTRADALRADAAKIDEILRSLQSAPVTTASISPLDKPLVPSACHDDLLQTALFAGAGLLTPTMMLSCSAGIVPVCAVSAALLAAGAYLAYDLTETCPQTFKCGWDARPGSSFCDP